jgi:hypothetical protein
VPEVYEDNIVRTSGGNLVVERDGADLVRLQRVREVEDRPCPTSRELPDFEHRTRGSSIVGCPLESGRPQGRLPGKVQTHSHEVLDRHRRDAEFGPGVDQPLR